MPVLTRGASDLRSSARWIRVGLRARVILAFSIGALLLSALLSGLVLGVTRTNLVNSREASATRIVYNNARIVRSNAGQQDLLQSLQTPEGSRPILLLSGTWTALDPEFNRDAIPAPLRQQVIDGQPARMRFVLRGSKQLAIGVPIPDIEGAYFEIVSLDSLDETLSSIGFTLFGASIATVLAGAALGWYSSRAILRPLTEVGSAARALAEGHLDARIEARVDPDLEPIVTSFNHMAGSLEGRIERDARFASDVSHELRSPLMTLQAAVEVLVNARDEMPERAAAALDLLSADIERFSQLVADLLEISRFDAGVMTLDLEDVVLPEFIRWATAAAGHPDAEVVADGDLETAIVAIDKRRIARVLANLLDNASKYGERTIRVHVSGDDDVVRIAVEDDGEGVPEEDRAKIFERFNRAASAHRRGGAGGVGLGLALVAEHVRLHDGAVWVEGSDLGGARFVIELPRVELPNDDGGDDAASTPAEEFA